ncbi:MAG TPA: ATP-binding protein [Myxococcota bacterium]
MTAPRSDLLDALERSLALGAARTAPDGALLERSAGFERLLGGGPSLLELVADEQREALRRALHALAAGEPERVVTVRAAGAPRERVLELRLRRAEPADGTVDVVVRDRSELERIERHLMHFERLRALGELALGCAHELNNLLGVIGQLASGDAGSSEPGDRALLQRCAEDARRLVQRLQAFARNEEPGLEATTLEPHEVLADALELTRVRWQREAAAAGITIEVEADLRPSGSVLGSASELRQAVANLIVNALDAMPGGGRLRVASRREGDEVVLEVGDTGVGMSAEIQQRIFEPFFSTKGAGGLGLGLSLVSEIVARHGGRLGAVSSPGSGSRFEIRLPAVDRERGVPARDGAPRPDGAAATDTQPRRILVVEDNAMLRRLMARHLRDDGHEVLECESAEEAEKLVESAAAFDLLIVDVSLPGRSGLDLVRGLRERGLRAPILLITAWGLDLSGVGASRVLTKPFGVDALRRAVAELRPDAS